MKKKSKFNLGGVKAVEVRGIMSDPVRLAAEAQRIREATQRAFDQYDRARRRATVAARSMWLD